MGKFNLVVLPGDGIGPEVITEGVKILRTVGVKYGHAFNLKLELVGGCAIDATAQALTTETLKLCKKADAVLLGAVGGPKWDNPMAPVRPEDGLLTMRKGMGVYANIRPVKVFPMLSNSTPLKPEVVNGVDLIVIRELTGGLYFGKPKKRWVTDAGRKGIDSLVYSEQEIARIVKVGFELAKTRRRKLTSVDKANVLETSRLWRQVTAEIAREYPDVQLENMLVDTCAMTMIQNPRSFDVIVTENTFGDILTDEASVLAGSMGLLPSASLSGAPQDGVMVNGLYEPIHGSAPSLTGKNAANPVATILTVSLMLRYSLGLPVEADAVEQAVADVLAEGYRTNDIMSPGMKNVGTREMGSLVASKIGG